MRPVGRSAMSGWLSVCSSLSNMALRLSPFALACFAAVCLFVGEVAAPCAAAPPLPGLGCSFALLFGSRSAVGRTHVTSGWNQLKGCTERFKIYSTVWTRDVRVYAKNPNLLHTRAHITDPVLSLIHI